MTHLPTGIVVACQDERSQIQNRERALKILRARLYERALEERNAAEAAERLSQIGTGERSEKIRTYNFPERRVTDHRIKFTSHNLDAVLAGDLAAFTQALQDEDRSRRLEAANTRVSNDPRAARARAGVPGRQGVPSPKLDAEYLLAHVLGIQRLELYLDHDRPLEPAEVAPARAVRRRGGASRSPTCSAAGASRARLLCDARALVPRPETEVLVERCLALLAGGGSPLPTSARAPARSPSRSPRVLPDARVTAIDICADALALAAENRAAPASRSVSSSSRATCSRPSPGRRFDLIASNPPYVAAGDAVDAEVAGTSPRGHLRRATGAGDPQAPGSRCARGALGSGGHLRPRWGRARRRGSQSTWRARLRAIEDDARPRGVERVVCRTATPRGLS